jgi:hypothetical protein
MVPADNRLRVVPALKSLTELGFGEFHSHPTFLVKPLTLETRLWYKPRVGHGSLPPDILPIRTKTLRSMHIAAETFVRASPKPVRKDTSWPRQKQNL